jgi:protein-S-isoprenylcysteine O-methyltransferase Ste14
MTPYEWIRYAWATLALVWLLAAFGSKRAARRQSSGSVISQVALMALTFSLLFTRQLRVGPLALRIEPESDLLAWAGVAITFAGIAFAIWARFYLGGNWSGTVTVKKDHTLVRGGPYSIVRHPIYSGLALAILGTALQIGELGGFVALVIAVFAWKQKSLLEEKFMVEQFASQYEQYRKEVKGLIPFVW